MKTYRITENEIAGLEPLAVGYKIFPHDWISKGYDYKDENGNVLGTIHKVDGEISECNWGLHFSKKPHDCFNFYESVQWNKFAKVEAYGEGSNLWAWHISDLKIYDEPKKITDFEYPCQRPSGGYNCYGCKYQEQISANKYGCNARVRRPPQSWCYVEEL